MTSLITHSPTAPDGSVTHFPSYRPSDFLPGSAVLCRNTAPLVAFAYALLQRDVPCRILGKDIGATLIGVVRKQRAYSLEDLLEKLRSWRDREVARAESEDRGSIAERVDDQYTCLRFFIESLDSDAQRVEDLIAKIELMFTDDSDDAPRRVTLSTIHKSKGLEYPTVFFLDKHLLPSKFAKQPWQLEQELNLMYVGITRAILNLVYIRSDCWKGDGE